MLFSPLSVSTCLQTKHFIPLILDLLVYACYNHMHMSTSNTISTLPPTHLLPPQNHPLYRYATPHKADLSPLLFSSLHCPFLFIQTASAPSTNSLPSFLPSFLPSSLSFFLPSFPTYPSPNRSLCTTECRINLIDTRDPIQTSFLQQQQ